MFFVPQEPDFQWYYSNALNSQPATAVGTSITPGTTTDVYGAWAQVATAANMAQDTYGVYINFNSGTTAGQVRNILCEMGVDNTGGTSYQPVIPYLMAGNASLYTSLFGIYYYFPLYIKAGSSVAFRAMSNSATALRVNVYFYGQPRRPESLRVGSYVDAFGVNSATRTGTSITPGTTSEGTAVQLGSATTKNYWWWQCGLSNNATIATNYTIIVDMLAGDATNRKLLFENQPWYLTANQTVSSIQMFSKPYNDIASGQNIYGRAQQDVATALTSATMIAYGLGG